MVKAFSTENQTDWGKIVHFSGIQIECMVKVNATEWQNMISGEVERAYNILVKKNVVVYTPDNGPSHMMHRSSPNANSVPMPY